MSAKHAAPATTPTTTVQSECESFPNHVRAGLALLWQARLYAQDAGTDLWDFALRTNKLYDAGLTISDLRWLVSKGFVQHAQETSIAGAPHRSFLPEQGIVFVPATCIVLTASGVALAELVMADSADPQTTTVLVEAQSVVGGMAPGIDGAEELDLKPHWDSMRRELSLADAIVKRFRVPARNQETILCVFEEEGWPEHIDDPLPTHGHIDPQTRLHDTINRLNRCQTHSLLRFHGNGHGTGVRWELHRKELSSQALVMPSANG